MNVHARAHAHTLSHRHAHKIDTSALTKRTHTHADTGNFAIPDRRGDHGLVVAFDFCYNSFADDSACVLLESHSCV